MSDEAEKHGEALRSISTYLQSFMSSYILEESRDKARREVEAL